MKKINKLMLITLLSFFLIFVSCSTPVKENFSENPKPLEKEATEGQYKKNDLAIMLSEIEEIVDPNNILWPRVVKINDKEIVFNDKPKRITTFSLGHDEILSSKLLTFNEKDFKYSLSDSKRNIANLSAVLLPIPGSLLRLNIISSNVLGIEFIKTPETQKAYLLI